MWGASASSASKPAKPAGNISSSSKVKRSSKAGKAQPASKSLLSTLISLVMSMINFYYNSAVTMFTAAQKATTFSISASTASLAACFAVLSAMVSLSGFALLGLLFMTRHYAPASFSYSRPLNFDYSAPVAIATAMLSPNLSEQVAFHKMPLPAPAAALIPKSRFLPSGQEVSLCLDLHLPSSHVDLFQLTGELLTDNNTLIARSTRTYMSHVQPLAYRLFKTFMLFPLHLVGWYDDSTHVSLTLFDKYEEREDLPVERFKAYLTSRSATNGVLPPPPVYRAEVHIRLKLGLGQTLLYWLRPGLTLSVLLGMMGLAAAFGGSSAACALLGIAYLLHRVARQNSTIFSHATGKQAAAATGNKQGTKRIGGGGSDYSGPKMIKGRPIISPPPQQQLSSDEHDEDGDEYDGTNDDYPGKGWRGKRDDGDDDDSAGGGGSSGDAHSYYRRGGGGDDGGYSFTSRGGGGGGAGGRRRPSAGAGAGGGYRQRGGGGGTDAAGYALEDLEVVRSSNGGVRGGEGPGRDEVDDGSDEEGEDVQVVRGGRAAAAAAAPPAAIGEVGDTAMTAAVPRKLSSLRVDVSGSSGQLTAQSKAGSAARLAEAAAAAAGKGDEPETDPGRGAAAAAGAPSSSPLLSPSEWSDATVVSSPAFAAATLPAAELRTAAVGADPAPAPAPAAAYTPADRAPRSASQQQQGVFTVLGSPSPQASPESVGLSAGTPPSNVAEGSYAPYKDSLGAYSYGCGTDVGATSASVSESPARGEGYGGNDSSEAGEGGGSIDGGEEGDSGDGDDDNGNGGAGGSVARHGKRDAAAGAVFAGEAPKRNMWGNVGAGLGGGGGAGGGSGGIDRDLTHQADTGKHGSAARRAGFTWQP